MKHIFLSLLLISIVSVRAGEYELARVNRIIAKLNDPAAETKYMGHEYRWLSEHMSALDLLDPAARRRALIGVQKDRNGFYWGAGVMSLVTLGAAGYTYASETLTDKERISGAVLTAGCAAFTAKMVEDGLMCRSAAQTIDASLYQDKIDRLNREAAHYDDYLWLAANLDKLGQLTGAAKQKAVIELRRTNSTYFNVSMMYGAAALFFGCFGYKDSTDEKLAPLVTGGVSAVGCAGAGAFYIRSYFDLRKQLKKIEDSLK